MDMSQTTRNKLGMPLVGFGTYQLTTEQAEVCVRDALQAGFRHIDSAQGYNNEVGTGKAIKAAGIARDEIFVTTKLFPGYAPWGSVEKTFDDTINTLKHQLTELQLDYVDMYMIHAPFSSLRLDQWQACMELKKMGLTKHIGVANYNVSRLKEIIAAGLALPEANQVEFHPLCAQVELTKFIRQKGIVPIAYSSLAPLASWRMEAGQGGEVLSEIKAESQIVLSEMANRMNVPQAKLLLRWGIQHGYCVLTKSSKPERIRDNLNIFDFSISDEDMARLDQLNQNQAIAWAANGLNPMEVADPLK